MAKKKVIESVEEDIVIAPFEPSYDCDKCIINYQDPAEEEPEKELPFYKRGDWSKLFTAIVAVVFGIYAIGSGIAYYELCKMAIAAGSEMPDCSLPVTCVTTVIASLWSYCAYQGLLKTSLNKNNLTIDKDGVVKKIVEFAEENLDKICK